MEKYLSSKFDIFGVSLKKYILKLMWLVHEIQYWLTYLVTSLESESPKPLPETPVNIYDDCYINDPFYLLRRGISLLLYWFYLGVAKFCFRFSQVAFLAALSAYIRMGFNAPVPLVILNGLDK